MSGVVKAFLEAGAALPLLRELMGFAGVDTKAIAERLRSAVSGAESTGQGRT